MWLKEGERKGREKSGKATKLRKLKKAESDKMEMAIFMGKGLKKGRMKIKDAMNLF